MSVWIDGPWDNAAWKGRKLGEIEVPAGSASSIQEFTLDVSSDVDGLKGKHAIYLVAEGKPHMESCIPFTEPLEVTVVTILHNAVAPAPKRTSLPSIAPLSLSLIHI